MIQSFSIVFAGYKMPACLRPAMSSSSPLPGTCVGVWVSGLSPSLAQSDIITLSPISSPLSLLTGHQVWRSPVCCRIGIIPSKPWSEDYRGEQQTSKKQVSNWFLQSFLACCVTQSWWGGAWESLYPSSVRAGMKPWQWGIFLSNPFKVTIHLIWS